MRGCEIELPGPDVQKMNLLQDLPLNDRNRLRIVCWGNQLQTLHPEAWLERHRWVTDDYSPLLSAGETHPEHCVRSCASQYERDMGMLEQMQWRATETIKGLERLTLLWAGGSGWGDLQRVPSSLSPSAWFSENPVPRQRDNPYRALSVKSENLLSQNKFKLCVSYPGIVSWLSTMFFPLSKCCMSSLQIFIAVAHFI